MGKMTPLTWFLGLVLWAAGSAWGQSLPRAALAREMLLFPLQAQHVHGSSLVHLPNGDLLAAWFQGSGERSADDVQIMGARLQKGHKAWSSPFPLADTPGLPDCNPVLFLNGKGKLFLVWIAVQANRWEHSLLRVRTTLDYAKKGPPLWQWQDNILLKPGEEFAAETALKFRDLPPATAGWSEYAPRYDQQILEASRDLRKRSTGWMTRIHPLILPGGRILLPLYSDGFNMSLVAISDDDGESWFPSRPIVGRGPIQPALARKKNGQLVAYMRDSGDAPARVQHSISADNGQTWSAALKTEIPNTASVELLVLQDGRWAFVGNDTGEGRHQLSLYLSADEGLTWKWRLALEAQAPGQGSYSYPSLIQTPDGLLHLTYSCHLGNDRKTIKYIALDPGKIPGTP
jgi:predicted neuraminidase